MNIVFPHWLEQLISIGGGLSAFVLMESLIGFAVVWILKKTGLMVKFMRDDARGDDKKD